MTDKKTYTEMEKKELIENLFRIKAEERAAKDLRIEVEQKIEEAFAKDFQKSGTIRVDDFKLTRKKNLKSTLTKLGMEIVKQKRLKIFKSVLDESTARKLITASSVGEAPSEFTQEKYLVTVEQKPSYELSKEA